MLNVTPVTLGVFPHPISDDIDLNPHIIAPRAGLTNLSTVYVDQVVVEPDGKTLLVSLIHGDMCSLFARIDTKETARTVTLTGYVGDEPGGPTCPGGGHAGDAARIELKQPLGNRRIVDGTDPSLTVQVARRAGR